MDAVIDVNSVAPQVLHKAPIKEPKHIEHVLNERRTQVLLSGVILSEQASSSCCSAW